jgi:DNA repair protein RecO (recombination protein O)
VSGQSQHSQAFLLRSVDYADADRIVTLLTSSFGKLSCIARNARRSRKRFGGALEPLALLDVELRQGQGQLATLLSAHVARAFPRILAELPRMSAGFAALELLRELSAEHQPDPGVFATALELLGALDAAQVAPEQLLLCFEVRLLGQLGFAPRLDQCGQCGKRPRDGQAVLFDPRLGHLSCRGCGGAQHRLSGLVRGELQRAGGPRWVEAAASAWPARELSQAREALRAFVEHRIGRSLGAAAPWPQAAGEQS